MDSLNLLQLAPGGHLGRFIIWTKPAFQKLDKLFGTVKSAAKLKKDYKLPKPTMANADLARIINSDEVQSRLRPVAVNRKRRVFTQKKNPLKSTPQLMSLRQSQQRATRPNNKRPKRMLQKHQPQMKSRQPPKATPKRQSLKKHPKRQSLKRQSLKRQPLKKPPKRQSLKNQPPKKRPHQKRARKKSLFQTMFQKQHQRKRQQKPPLK